MEQQGKNPQRISLLAGENLWGFLRLWICVHKPVFTGSDSGIKHEKNNGVIHLVF